MIDLRQLAIDMDKMSTRSQLYEVIKAEMVKRGRWKTAPRGKAFKKGEDERRKPFVKK